jgi:hypothetical protein
MKSPKSHYSLYLEEGRGLKEAILNHLKEAWADPPKTDKKDFSMDKAINLFFLFYITCIALNADIVNEMGLYNHTLQAHIILISLVDTILFYLACKYLK